MTATLIISAVLVQIEAYVDGSPHGLERTYESWTMNVGSFAPAGGNDEARGRCCGRQRPQGRPYPYDGGCDYSTQMASPLSLCSSSPGQAVAVYLAPSIILLQLVDVRQSAFGAFVDH